MDVWELGDQDCRDIIIGAIKVILDTTMEEIDNYSMHIYESNCKVYVALSYGICCRNILGIKTKGLYYNNIFRVKTQNWV